MARDIRGQFATANIRPELVNLRKRFDAIFRQFAFGNEPSLTADREVVRQCLRVLKPSDTTLDEGIIPINYQSPLRRTKPAIILEIIRCVLLMWVRLPHTDRKRVQASITKLKDMCDALEMILAIGLENLEIRGQLAGGYWLECSEEPVDEELEEQARDGDER